METSARHLISNEYTEIFSRVPLRLQLAYGVGHVLNDICASMWFTYLLVFFHLVLGFSNWEAGFILLVGQVADALATPFVGFHSDRTDNTCLCRYGGRKAWHLVGTLCILVAFPNIFAPCPGCEGAHKWAQLFYYSVCVVIFQFGWAAVQISHLSLIPELTPNEHDRTKLTAMRYCFTVISNLLVYIVTWFVLHISSGETQIGPSDTAKFQEVVWIGLVVGIVTSCLFHIFVKEANGHTGNDVRGGQLRRSVGDLLSSGEVYKVAVVYMSTRLFVNLTQVFIPLFLHETLKMPGSALALIPLIMFIGSFLTSFLIETLNRRLGRRIAYILGVVLGILPCIWIQFRTGEASFIEYDIYGVAVLFGAGGSIILVTSLGITADLIGDKTGSGAFVYGVMSFCDKLSNGIAVVIIQDLHKDSSKSTYYRDIITYVCGGSALLGALAVITLMQRLREAREGYEVIPGVSSINSDNVNNDKSQASLIS